MSGKKSVDNAKKFDRDQLFTPTEALALVKTMANAKFDETVDIAVRLGVDPRKADQMVRGTVGLPSGTGKDVRVAVFAAGEAAQEARDAGADMVGADELAAEIQAGNFNFDVAIATPDMMPLVGRLGRVLGPRGLMPNPKTGTVTQDVGRAVGEFKVARSSTAPTATATCTCSSARPASRWRRWRPTSAPCWKSCSGPSRRRPRAAT